MEKKQRATTNFLLYLIHCQQRCCTRVLWIRLHFRYDFKWKTNVNMTTTTTISTTRWANQKEWNSSTPFSCLFMFRKMIFFVFIVIEIFLHQSNPRSRQFNASQFEFVFWQPNSMEYTKRKWDVLIELALYGSKYPSVVVFGCGAMFFSSPEIWW